MLSNWRMLSRDKICLLETLYNSRKVNDRIFCKQEKTEFWRLISIALVAMATRKALDITIPSWIPIVAYPALTLKGLYQLNCTTATKYSITRIRETYSCPQKRVHPLHFWNYFTATFQAAALVALAWSSLECRHSAIYLHIQNCYSTKTV